MKIYTCIIYILYTYIHTHTCIIILFVCVYIYLHTHTHILGVVDLDPEGLTERHARTLARRTVGTLPRRYPQRVPR
jgi:hypothetical protein